MTQWRQEFGLVLRMGDSLETPNLGQNQSSFVPCDLDILQMTLKDNKASLLCYFKLCHYITAINEFKLELQSIKAPFMSKSQIFAACVTLKFDG